ncbi:LuxR C-terminal-related transcriptional regulator [Sphingobacterium lactis]|uniref:Regulatory protein, luxR family n=1 Tax=Sphingobacterium lactis TaxID=797291 RepID=A0A1H5XXT6_9SPHI|nr:LuxR C-terminal-related transcriptional regulator [Sphingobacterium lactis]SEG16442.1 regulatory protein, luxR family [Sphingobacterium lactis]
MHNLDAHLFSISKRIDHGELDISDIGAFLPAGLMLHELIDNVLFGVTYMNEWGCNTLGTTPEELNMLGEHYYDKYFVKAEMLAAKMAVTNHILLGDPDHSYNYFQRVKFHGHSEYTWCYTSCKFFRDENGHVNSNKILIMATPISGVDNMVSRVIRTLEQEQYILENYKRFAMLTKREKEIIKLLVNGQSSNCIAEQLFISFHTVTTHRKNICAKLEVKSFAELLKFALNFDLT